MYADTVDCANPALAWMWLTQTPASTTSSGAKCRSGSRSHCSNRSRIGFDSARSARTTS
jgi:hypothetical protein